ncbi:hypothetical protein ABK040_002372 [Willaertia magna]
MACVDVILVKQLDGTLKSTPFFVRVPQRTKQRRVLQVYVNGHRISNPNCRLVVDADHNYGYFLNTKRKKALPPLPKRKEDQITTNSTSATTESSPTPSPLVNIPEVINVPIITTENEIITKEGENEPIVVETFDPLKEEDLNNNTNENRFLVGSGSDQNNGEKVLDTLQKTGLDILQTEEDPDDEEKELYQMAMKQVNERNEDNIKTKKVEDKKEIETTPTPSSSFIVSEALQSSNDNNAQQQQQVIVEPFNNDNDSSYLYTSNSVTNTEKNSQQTTSSGGASTTLSFMESWLTSINNETHPEHQLIPSNEYLSEIYSLLHPLDSGKPNVIVFVDYSTPTPLKIFGNIYEFSIYDKIIISDVDGTVTKSDILGQLYYKMGKDYTHGGIAKLYNSISAHGYRFIYLSARPITQASQTRDYIQSIVQDDCRMPQGPIITSPNKAFNALAREVIIRKPETFKISCLKSISSIFPKNPFYGGFGNRPTDCISYVSSCVDPTRCYRVNKKGEVLVQATKIVFRSYSDLQIQIKKYFPTFTKEEIDRAQDDLRSLSEQELSTLREQYLDPEELNM